MLLLIAQSMLIRPVAVTGAAAHMAGRADGFGMGTAAVWDGSDHTPSRACGRPRR